MSEAVNDLRRRVSSDVVQEKRLSGSVIHPSATGCDQALTAIGSRNKAQSQGIVGDRTIRPGLRRIRMSNILDSRFGRFDDRNAMVLRAGIRTGLRGNPVWREPDPELPPQL